jgi:hypothetical protein
LKEWTTRETSIRTTTRECIRSSTWRIRRRREEAEELREVDYRSFSSKQREGLWLADKGEGSLSVEEWEGTVEQQQVEALRPV